MSKTVTYKWKAEWKGKNVPIEKAINAFEKTKETFGKLTPETLLEYSKDPGSELHSLFTWDDAKAAIEHRKQQARIIINNVHIEVISDGEPMDIPAYEIVRDDGVREYKNTSTLVENEVDQIKAEIIQQIKIMKNKLRIYSKYQDIVFDLDTIENKLVNIE